MLIHQDTEERVVPVREEHAVAEEELEQVTEA